MVINGACLQLPVVNAAFRARGHGVSLSLCLARTAPPGWRVDYFFSVDRIPDFDPADWHVQPADHLKSHGDGGEEADPEDQPRDHGDGRAVMDAASADLLLAHSNRMQSLRGMQALATDVGGVIGTTLKHTLERIMHREQQHFHARVACDPTVSRELRSSVEASIQQFRDSRAAHQATLEIFANKRRAAKELKDVQDQVKKARKASQELGAAVAAKDAIKTYTAEMLGDGKPLGGGAQFQKARAEVLDRLRSLFELSPEQRNDWPSFKQSWDKALAAAIGETWGQVFAEIVQYLLDELEDGNTSALSEFMVAESLRVLRDVPVLRVPGSAPHPR